MRVSPKMKMKKSRMVQIEKQRKSLISRNMREKLDKKMDYLPIISRVTLSRKTAMI